MMRAAVMELPGGDAEGKEVKGNHLILGRLL